MGRVTGKGGVRSSARYNSQAGIAIQRPNILPHPQVASDPHDLAPTFHLPHLLRILGPSSLTLYKHLLGRRRILIYTLPPVEAACILCHVAADMCYEIQTDVSSEAGPSSRSSSSRWRARSKETINVLGMVTLNDLDRMREDGLTGRGWVACGFFYSVHVLNW